MGSLELVLAFIIAVADHWATLMTGGLIIAGLTLWERFHRPIPRKLYAAIAACAVLIAFYQAWLDQKQENIHRLEALKSQHFQIMNFALRKYGLSTKYSLDMLVRNSGPQAASVPVPILHDPILTTVDLTDQDIDKIMEGLERKARGRALPDHIKDTIEPAY